MINWNWTGYVTVVSGHWKNGLSLQMCHKLLNQVVLHQQGILSNQDMFEIYSNQSDFWLIFRLENKQFAELNVDEFACAPDLLAAARFVEANSGKLA